MLTQMMGVHNMKKHVPTPCLKAKPQACESDKGRVWWPMSAVVELIPK